MADSSLQVKKFMDISGNDNIVVSNDENLSLVKSVNDSTPDTNGNVKLSKLIADETGEVYKQVVNLEDGIEVKQSNLTTGSFNTIAYVNNLFVAGSGSNKGIYYSTDGITWTRSNQTTGSFNTIAYGNNLFVAGGEGIYYFNHPIQSIPLATKNDIPQLPSFSDITKLPDDTYTINDLKEKINLILSKFGVQ